jgi:hypothetical protein
MPKRFSKYKSALKLLRQLDASGNFIDTDTPATLPKNSPLDNYRKYISGESPGPEVNQPAKEGTVEGTIKPFYAGDLIHIEKITVRTNNWLTTNTAVKTAAALTIPSAADPNPVPASWNAARAVIFIPGTGEDTDATPISGISGIEYNRILGRSYTVPFGKTADTDTYWTKRADIKTAVTGLGVEGATISFKNEVIR